MRDITLEETCYFNFTTRAFATGVPTVLGGSPVLSVLESNNATPITAGVSVSVDRASVVGLNQATVVATAANGYEAGKSYCVYISTGTVGGVSVVGEVVAQFTVQTAAAFTRLGAPAGASVSADIAAIEAQTDDIGAAGAGLTAVPWNAAWDAEVQSEVNDGLVAYNAASTTNITAGTITTTTNLTNLPAITANWLTATGIAAGALDGKGNWNVGKTGYSLTATTGLGNQTADITGNLSGSVGSVTGAVGSVTGAVGSVTGLTASDVGAIKAKTDSLTYTVANVLDANVQRINDVVITGNGQVGTEFGV